MNVRNSAARITGSTVVTIEAAVEAEAIAVPFMKILPLISEIGNISNEVIEITQAAEHNKRTCGFLLQRIYAVDLQLKVRRDNPEFFNNKNYLCLQNLVNVMTQIKKFITEISQMKTSLKYIQEESIEKNFKELCKKFDSYISVLNLSVEQLRADQELNECLKEIGDGIKSLNVVASDEDDVANLCKEFSSTVIKINAMDNTMERILNPYIISNDYINQSIVMQIQKVLLSDLNVRDIFLGSEKVENWSNTIKVSSRNNQKLYVIVDNVPTKPLQMLGDFPIIYIEWRTFTELGPKNSPPPRALPLDTKKKFYDILDTHLGLKFRSKFINLIAISLDWKITDRLYIEKPAVVFYVIRKGVIPIGNDLFPKTINIDIETNDYIETDVREGFYEPTGYSGDCQKFLEFASPGCSIGITGTSRAGTLGAFVKDSNEHIYLLTNDHVIRSEYGSNNDQAMICQPAETDHIDPFENELIDLKAQLDNSQPVQGELEREIKDLQSALSEINDEEEKKAIRTRMRKLKTNKEIYTKIKRVEEDLENARSENIQFASFTKGVRGNYEMNKSSYGVDAAIALINQDLRDIRPDNFAIRDRAFEEMTTEPIQLSGLKCIIKDVETIDSSKFIFKVGRTSGLTKGYIKEELGSILSADGSRTMLEQQSAIFHGIQMEESKVRGGRDFPSMWLDRQILVRPKTGLFMEGGDSGCVWFDQSGAVIALGHGTLNLTIGEYAVGSPISAVLKALDVDLYVNED